MTYRFAGAVFALFLLAGPAFAQSQCPPFPEVEWWKNLNHETTQRYVVAKYNGDWNSYVAKWQRQLSIIENIYARGKAAVVRSTGTRLSGEALRQYIINIERRLAVIECLAAEAGTGTVAAPTAPTLRPTKPTRGRAVIKPPPGPMPLPEDQQFQGDSTEITVPVPGSGADAKLAVEISTRCEGSDTIFRVINRGALWPRPSVFKVTRTNDGATLSERRIRMASGQSISFRVQSADSMELRITPPWNPDDFRIAQTQCR